MAVIYLIAFGSFWVQVDGLIGSDGILPAPIQFSRLAANTSYFELPSLLLFMPSDVGLHILCALGCATAIFLLLDLLSPIAAIGAWAIYLSLIHAGQVFMSFQWDVLLVEYGFLSIWVSLWLIFSNHKSLLSKTCEKLIYASIIILAFKLMFSSGVVKIFGGGSWLDLTALKYHFFTQPIPGPLSSWLHKLPESLLTFACATTFYLELLVPLALLIPSKSLRHMAAMQLIGLQILFMLSGNFAFFNLLSIVIFIPLLSFTSSDIPNFSAHNSPILANVTKIVFLITSLILIFLLFLNLKVIWNTCKLENILPITISQRINGFIKSSSVQEKAIKPFLLVNSYGLFARMTTRRPEIQIQASIDGRIWKNYEFKYKLNGVHQKLSQVAPHQPRLDWQMWFAALRGTFPDRGWLPNFILRLLQNEKSVKKLLKASPYDKKPRFIRAYIVFYEFENSDTIQNIWKIVDERLFFGPVELNSKKSRGDAETSNSRS
ncbi:MAG: lipase maturation factor family protein [bacterium]|nr:lipase maturation factor family protein [bacterium]